MLGIVQLFNCTARARLALGTLPDKVTDLEALGGTWGSTKGLQTRQNRSKNKTQIGTSFGPLFGPILDQFWGHFGGQFEPKIGPIAPRCKERQHDLPSAKNCAFTKTSKNLQFFKVFGVQGRPRQPRNGQADRQEAPKELQNLQKKGSKNATNF